MAFDCVFEWELYIWFSTAFLDGLRVLFEPEDLRNRFFTCWWKRYDELWHFRAVRLGCCTRAVWAQRGELNAIQYRVLVGLEAVRNEPLWNVT